MRSIPAPGSVTVYGGGRSDIIAVPSPATALEHRAASPEMPFAVEQCQVFLAWLLASQLASDGRDLPVTVFSEGHLDPAGQRPMVLPSSSNSGRQLPPGQVRCLQIGNLEFKTVDFLFDGTGILCVLAADICLGPIHPESDLALTMASRDARLLFDCICVLLWTSVTSETRGIYPGLVSPGQRVGHVLALGPPPLPSDGSNLTVERSAPAVTASITPGSASQTDQRNSLVPTDGRENASLQVPSGGDVAPQGDSPHTPSDSELSVTVTGIVMGGR
ncbi:hypothetical protein JB92DRAFT_2200907 [Gautieria morchelliformis]|nr:hypothetical protein JB92DRAFT_2200907 [Gautieria morchelliformis]